MQANAKQKPLDLKAALNKISSKTPVLSGPKGSYVKTHKIHRVPEDKLLKYCGELESIELIRILNRIVEVNT